MVADIIFFVLPYLPAESVDGIMDTIAECGEEMKGKGKVYVDLTNAVS